MMRSLFSGVAGLKTHQTRMDVIGNNIANVNTVGYKSAQVNFQDLVYQTKANASGPNADTGRAGVNAKQIGLGVNMASIYSNVTSPGSAETTGNPFDIRINGESFFVVSDGSQQFYTRSGAFTVDADGTLCMSSNGYTVQGYGVVEREGVQEINTSSLVPLKIMSAENKTSLPSATSKGYFTGILDSNSQALQQDTGQVVDMKVYDNEGYRYTVKYKIKPGAAKGEFNLSVTDILDSNGKTIFRDQDLTSDPKESDTAYAAAKETFFSKALNVNGGTTDGNFASIGLTFDTTNGKMTGPFNNTDQDKVGFNLNLSDLLANATAVSSGTTEGLRPSAVPADAFTKPIVVDTSTLLNIDNKGTSTINGGNGGVNTTEGSGWSVGTLSSVSVGVDGKITGSYTNGQTRLLGQIASAIFSNASGLEKAGDNLYVETMNSGDPVIGDVTANGGSYASGELEMSNVDLSSEFTTMITTQRGFQANSRIITVSDSMLEELINLKR
ncbi:MAG: flagellar hook protein FlgE [Lachnospiraceae bacterium]|nr:flagellar hook protein FlgE [Lachnospiraceae bacterium]